MSITRVGLIGNPVEHSRSPKMQNAAFAALDMDNHVYELWHTEAHEVAARVASIRAKDIAGANVTVPHKQAVMEHLDEISETARRIGAVNTIIPDGERLIGDNTDGYGFAASIVEKYPDFKPETVVVLGAGGASRAVIVAMQQAGADVTIANRTRNKADALAAELGASAIDWDDLPVYLPETNLLINSTSLGWHDEVVLPEETVAHLPEGALVADLTYRNTPLLQAGARLGLRTLDGAGMLIHQGVRAFELWFGVTPPVDVMTQAALSD